MGTLHGETLGLVSLSPRQTADVWRGVGCQLARLHLRVLECADPQGYLDEPARDQDVDVAVKRLVDAKKLDIKAAGQVEHLTNELRPVHRHDYRDTLHPWRHSPDEHHVLG